MGKSQPDLIVVGAGIFGLWAARHAIKQGRSVVVLEKRRLGAGASGGFMGALMPHMPDRWDKKAELQFDALNELEDLVGELEEDTGAVCGFRRCGRLVPLVHEKTRELVRYRKACAEQHWRGKFNVALVENSELGRYSNWLDPDCAPFGAQWDDFSARIDPRSYLQALADYVMAHGEIRLETGVARLEPETRSVVLDNGDRVSAGEICVAAGWEAYDLLQPFMGPMNEGKSIGRGVKGQAILLEFAHDDQEPILFHDGAYVIPQSNNRVATGSTSVNGWQKGDTPEADAFDPNDVGFLENARKMAPVLKEANIVEQWANVRPRNSLNATGNAPFFGTVPGYDGLAARIGGFKIGMGIAGVANGR